MSRWENVEGFVITEKALHGTLVKHFHIMVPVDETCLVMDIRVTIEDLNFFPELYGETLDEMVKRIDRMLISRKTRLRMDT